jgi:hypothetical protein
MAPNALIPAPPMYGTPNCIPFEVSAFMTLLPTLSSPFNRYKMDHLLPTPSCDLRISYSLSLSRICRPSSVYPCICDNYTTKLGSKHYGLRPIILSHTRHTIRFHPRGVRVFSTNFILDQTRALRLDACQHVRLSADSEDDGNLIAGILACAAGEKDVVGHESCGRKRTRAHGSNQNYNRNTRGRGEDERWRAENGRGRRIDRGQVRHWYKCREQECGAEIHVWFDPKGVEVRSLGNGVLRIDVYKVLRGGEDFIIGQGEEQNSERQKGEEYNGKEQKSVEKRWERGLSPVEDLWNEKGEDIYHCLSDDDSDILSFLEA